MLKRALLVAAALLSALIICEGLLQASIRLGASFSPYRSPFADRIIPDRVLGVRPNPGFPEHDWRGYRNPETPSPIDIVVLGDSQTYGESVPTSETWPQKLAESTKLSVYQIACGGWGPTHHLLLLSKALALKPRAVIATLYMGNDFYDSYDMVWVRGMMRGMRTADPLAAARIAARESAATLADEIKRASPSSEAERNALRRMLHPFTSRIKLFTLWRALSRRVSHAAAHPTPPPAASPSTIFTPAYRLCALDLEDPRIAEGLSISLRGFERMDRLARSHGVGFAVLLIPTKEAALRNESLPEAAPILEELRIMEARARNETIRFLDKHGIPWIDASPVLREAARSGAPPYPPTADGHPNASGHTAIAAAAKSRLPKIFHDAHTPASSRL